MTSMSHVEKTTSPLRHW